jgi:leucine dehydrogenase
MHVFSEMMSYHHEQVVFGYDPEAGLRAIIAIHDTSLGPALGGTRMWPYRSEAEALNDVLRLSRGMTAKAAVAGLNLGGGKGVIIGDASADKNEILFRAYGRLVQGLHGRFITAEDVGTEVRDMEWVRAETPYVVGTPRVLGGSGDPSPFTARGVYYGMQACIEEVFGTSSLDGMRIAIQGLGHVGMHLAELLAEHDVTLMVTDLHAENVQLAAEKFHAVPVGLADIYSVDADIFAPCALGGILNDETIPQLQAKIVAGAANNQLQEEDKHGAILKDKGILYAPDYVINAGGLINVAHEIEGYHRQYVLEQVETIYGILKRVIQMAKVEDIPTHLASERMAAQRIEQVAQLRRKFVTVPAVPYTYGRMFR